MKHTFNIELKHAYIAFNNKGETKDSHFPILHRLLNFMKDRGFDVGRDPEIQKNYKMISKNYWYGRKGALEFKAERFQIGFRLQFFQNVVIENTNGGFYDFDKYDKMPYLIKLLFRNETKHIKAFLESLDCVDTTKPVHKSAYDRVVQDYIDSWHKPQKSSFKLEEVHGVTDETYNSKDHSGKTIHNGEIKYFRCRTSGRLARGIVYHNINNMWWVITNRSELRNITSFDLFDATDADFKVRRKKPVRKPESYLKRKEKLEEASAKELINELKRRGLKIAI